MTLLSLTLPAEVDFTSAYKPKVVLVVSSLLKTTQAITEAFGDSTHCSVTFKKKLGDVGLPVNGFRWMTFIHSGGTNCLVPPLQDMAVARGVPVEVLLRSIKKSVTSGWAQLRPRAQEADLAKVWNGKLDELRNVAMIPATCLDGLSGFTSVRKADPIHTDGTLPDPASGIIIAGSGTMPPRALALPEVLALLGHDADICNVSLHTCKAFVAVASKALPTPLVLLGLLAAQQMARRHCIQQTA